MAGLTHGGNILADHELIVRIPVPNSATDWFSNTMSPNAGETLVFIPLRKWRYCLDRDCNTDMPMREDHSYCTITSVQSIHIPKGDVHSSDYKCVGRRPRIALHARTGPSCARAPRLWAGLPLRLWARRARHRRRNRCFIPHRSSLWPWSVLWVRSSTCIMGSDKPSDGLYADRSQASPVR